MLKKKVLSLITEFIVILNHLGAIHVQWPQKITTPPTPSIHKEEQLTFCLKAKESEDIGQILRRPLSFFHVDVINVFSLTCLLFI